MRVLVLYLPLPFFWALFDQQGSRWTLQATRMNGNMGSWDIKPDQLQVLNPLLILAFIPLYDVAFYPALRLVGIRRPLQKLTMGGILAGIAFIISGVVELELEVMNPHIFNLHPNRLILIWCFHFISVSFGFFMFRKHIPICPKENCLKYVSSMVRIVCTMFPAICSKWNPFNWMHWITRTRISRFR